MNVRLDPAHHTLLVCPVRIYDRAGERSLVLRGAVDTRASNTMVPVEAARQLGYLEGTVGQERIVTGDSVVYAPRIVLARVSIEGASAQDIQATCHNLPEESTVDALVGLSFLTRFHLRFDFDAWEMELVPRG